MQDQGSYKIYCDPSFSFTRLVLHHTHSTSTQPTLPWLTYSEACFCLHLCFCFIKSASDIACPKTINFWQEVWYCLTWYEKRENIVIAPLLADPKALYNFILAIWEPFHSFIIMLLITSHTHLTVCLTYKFISAPLFCSLLSQQILENNWGKLWAKLTVFVAHKQCEMS